MSSFFCRKKFSNFIKKKLVMKKYSNTEILNYTAHRTWENPNKDWSFYQEWNKALFFHWAIEKEILEKLIPQGVELDTYNGKAWISLVAFTMEKIRPRLLPSFPPISTFHEINLRTYVTKDNKPGVYFLNIEAQKWLSGYLSRKISGLPYQKSKISHNLKNNKLIANFETKGFNLEVDYQIGNLISNKTDLDIFLTERYCLYLELNDELIRYEIHHLPWEVKELTYNKLKTNYFLKDIDLNRKPDLIRYSEGIQVLAWNQEVL